MILSLELEWRLCVTRIEFFSWMWAGPAVPSSWSSSGDVRHGASCLQRLVLARIPLHVWSERPPVRAVAARKRAAALRAFSTPTATKMLQCIVAVWRAAHPCGRWGVFASHMPGNQAAQQNTRAGRVHANTPTRTIMLQTWFIWDSARIGGTESSFLPVLALALLRGDGALLPPFAHAPPGRRALGGFWFCVWRLGVSAGGPAAQQSPPCRLIICHVCFLLLWIFVLKERSDCLCSAPLNWVFFSFPFFKSKTI